MTFFKKFGICHVSVSSRFGFVAFKHLRVLGSLRFGGVAMWGRQVLGLSVLGLSSFGVIEFRGC